MLVVFSCLSLYMRPSLWVNPGALVVLVGMVVLLSLVVTISGLSRRINGDGKNERPAY